MSHITAEMLLDAAYLMQGYRAKHGHKVQTTDPDSSELDTVAKLVEWSPRLNAIYTSLAAQNVYPGGVFSYEVTEEVGTRIGDMVKATGIWPEDQKIWESVLTQLKACYYFESLDPEEKQAFNSVFEKASGLKPVGLPYKRLRQAA